MIKLVASLVASNHKVDLTKPDKVIVVEIYQVSHLPQDHWHIVIPWIEIQHTTPYPTTLGKENIRLPVSYEFCNFCLFRQKFLGLLFLVPHLCKTAYSVEIANLTGRH